MSKRIHRYVAIIAPIKARFGCTAAQTADKINQLLAFEAKNDQLKAEIVELKKENAALKEAAEKLHKDLEDQKEKYAALETRQRELQIVLADTTEAAR